MTQGEAHRQNVFFIFFLCLTVLIRFTKNDQNEAVCFFIITQQKFIEVFRKIYIKWLVWRGKAVDIWSKGEYPADVLSNLCSNGFRFDGMVCGSMEGFLQSLKQKDKDKQRQICQMKGKNARKMTSTGWRTDQIVWWKGNPIDRQSVDYYSFVSAAYLAMFQQNERFRTALMSTRGMRLFHTRGEQDPFKTILTEHELCRILTDLRDNYDKRDKHLGSIKIVFEEDGREEAVEG